MRWPFLTRKVHDLTVLALRGQINALAADVVDAKGEAMYWRERAEKLADQALARKGEIDRPTFVADKPVKRSAIELLGAAMATKEIDSTKTGTAG